MRIQGNDLDGTEVGRMRRIGHVFWTETPAKTMCPKGLHDLSENDLVNMDKVFLHMVMYRKTKPVLTTILHAHWDDMKRARPFLEHSLSPRVESRYMKADGTWDSFWSSLC